MYIVFQTKYSYGYGITTDAEEIYPSSKNDIIGSFYAEEGAEWYATNALNLHIDCEDIEDEGYEPEELVETMDGDKFREILHAVLGDTDPYKEDPERGGAFSECDEKFKGPDVGFERYKDGDRVFIQTEFKYRFWIENGEIKSELVWPE